MGLGVHHLTLPWEMLTYDRELEGYHTDITEGGFHPTNAGVKLPPLQ